MKNSRYNNVVHGRDQFQRYKWLISLLCRFFSVFPPKERQKLLERARKTPGKRGLAIRYCFLKTIATSCGENIAIMPDVYLLNASKLKIGSNVSIHPMCYIECDGQVEIGNDVSIAHGTSILSSTHTYTDKDTPIKYQRGVDKKVTIQDNVWIGAKSTILPGVDVSSGCVVGANCVLTKSTEPDGVYVGVPARRIKDR